MPASADNPVGGHGTGKFDCGNDGLITWTPETVWPPNHQDAYITWTYTDPSDSNVSLTITAKPHSQAISDTEELVGSGNTPVLTDQLGGSNTSSGNTVTIEDLSYVRAERSGTEQGGRIYSFEYKATAGPAGMTDGCESDPDDDSDDLTVTVPHDCRENWCATVNANGNTGD